jgi:hypothetical protein
VRRLTGPDGPGPSSWREVPQWGLDSECAGFNFEVAVATSSRNLKHHDDGQDSDSEDLKGQVLAGPSTDPLSHEKGEPGY